MSVSEYMTRDELVDVIRDLELETLSQQARLKDARVLISVVMKLSTRDASTGIRTRQFTDKMFGDLSSWVEEDMP